MLSPTPAPPARPLSAPYLVQGRAQEHASITPCAAHDSPPRACTHLLVPTEPHIWCRDVAMGRMRSAGMSPDAASSRASSSCGPALASRRAASWARPCAGGEGCACRCGCAHGQGQISCGVRAPAGRGPVQGEGCAGGCGHARGSVGSVHMHVVREGRRSLACACPSVDACVHVCVHTLKHACACNTWQQTPEHSLAHTPRYARRPPQTRPT